MSKLHELEDRALMFAKSRRFFEQRNVLEVDTPLLAKAAPVDEHIEVMLVPSPQGEMRYLHTSAEYAMKRLLSLGLRDIYQISHVFREDEAGHLHNPEFTMVEWYRCDTSFSFLIEETLDFIRLFLGDLPSRRMSYRQAFQHFANIDSSTATIQDLFLCAKKHGLELPKDADSWSKDAFLSLLLGYVLEPHLGQKELFVLENFPPSQAALAVVGTHQGELVAKRFEVYFQSIELSNGYEELLDASEQRKRFFLANEKRKAAGKMGLVIDEKFLEALQKGLPACCGVAVGFDRLMLLRHQKAHIRDILPFAWEEL